MLVVAIGLAVVIVVLLWQTSKTEESNDRIRKQLDKWKDGEPE